MWYTVVAPLLRHGLGIAAGYFGTRYAVEIDAETINAIASGVLGFGAIVWSIVDKKRGSN